MGRRSSRGSSASTRDRGAWRSRTRNGPSHMRGPGSRDLRGSGPCARRFHRAFPPCKEHPTPQYAQVVVTARSGKRLGDETLLLQRRRRAGLDTRAAGDAFRVDERLVLARHDTRVEAASFDRERERALHFIARTHAARTDDAGIGIEAEVRIAVVDARGPHGACHPSRSGSRSGRPTAPCS